MSEKRQEENEQGERERVYAFSQSLLIINVSQVCKIALRSLCSILPSSSLPLAFLSLVHSVFSLLPRGVGYLTLSISIFPQSGVAVCFTGRRNANILTVNRATSIQPGCPSWLCVPDQKCGQSWWQCAAITTEAMSSTRWNLVPLSVKFRLKYLCYSPCSLAACSLPVEFAHEIKQHILKACRRN